MRAQLKEFLSSDIEFQKYWPDQEDDFGFFIQAIIGPEGEEGGDIFGFQVCTPKWLLNRYSENEVVFLRHTVIVFEYDIQRIEEKVANYCNEIIGASWVELAQKLSTLGRWEFANYKDYRAKGVRPLK